MNKRVGQFKVYFEDNGDLRYRAPYVSRWQSQQPGYVAPVYKTEDNHVFQDRLEYSGYYQSVITFKSVNSGRRYHMFLRHFDEMMKKIQMNHNMVEGNFTFAKHGNVQGLKMVFPKNP